MPTDATTETFHSVVADLEYPMAIVTTAHGDERAGCLVGFTAQCSIEPPLVMVWLSKRNRTTRVARRADGLLLHFPSRHQGELAAVFGSQSGDEVDKFDQCGWEPGPAGLPLLTDCTRWVAGRIVERLETGDHVGHLITVFDAAAGEWDGQLGFQAVKNLNPGHAP